MVSLEKRMLQNFCSLSLPEGSLQERLEHPFNVSRTKGNGFKLKERGFGLGIRKKFFVVRVAGAGCPEKLWIYHQGKYSRPGWTGF